MSRHLTLDDYTRNPTPTSFGEQTLNPTPSNFVAGVTDVSSGSKTVDTIGPVTVPHPTAAPTWEPVVQVMQKVIPSWNLNEGETYTVLVLFFASLIAIVAVAIYCIYFARGSKKDVPPGSLELESDASNLPPASEAAPLLPNKDKPNLPLLKEMLAVGKNVQMYTNKGPKTVKLTLKGKELYWETTNFVNNNTYMMDLSTVLFVTANKKSKNLKAKAVVPDELCLSLVAHDSSLDISVGKKSERDIMVLGFTEIIANIKDGNPV